ncbi:Fic family protein [Capnocytophaga granulosa]|uniref:Fic family protein n=1 Tax=Capnocytophaga granulosa TaxID=45242 RepID=UPI00385726F0
MSEFDDYVEQYIRDYEAIREIYQKNVIETFDPQDYNNYIQDLFTAHSCAIEGNSFSVNDTRELREHSLNLKLYNKSLCEAFEILDHFKAYEYVMKHLDSPLSEEFIKKIHFILTEHTIEYRSKFGKPGEYTTLDMAAGDTLFGDHRENIALVPKLLAQTQRILEEKTLHPMVLAAQFHRFFIYLHPFADGNGRLGRLLSNFILAQNKLPLIIIPAEAKNDYIDALKSCKKHRTHIPIISFFFKTAIEQMKNEIAQKKNLTENFYLNFKDTE